MIGKIIKYSKRQLTIEFEEEINENYLSLLGRGQENLAKVDALDNDPRSLKQNALAHALIGDIAKHDGMSKRKAKEKLQASYFKTEDIEFRHRDASKTGMNNWIEFLIEYVLEEGVQLPRRYEYLLEYDRFFYFACKYRKCCVCGATHAQIHHIEAVGNQKRNKVDHRKFPLAALCYKHHNQAHQMGVDQFLSIFKVIPIYLDGPALIEIGIMNRAQILRIDQQYETEDLFKKATGG